MPRDTALHPPVRKAVAWYCPACGERVHAHQFNAEARQRQYWQAVRAFNADPRLRTCATCQTLHPPVDLGDIAWLEVAAALEG